MIESYVDEYSSSPEYAIHYSDCQKLMAGLAKDVCLEQVEFFKQGITVCPRIKLGQLFQESIAPIFFGVFAASYIGDWSFHTKDIMSLQAADTVAYEFYKIVLNEKIQQMQRPIRLSARDLFRQHEIPYFRTFNSDLFESLLRDWDGTI